MLDAKSYRSIWQRGRRCSIQSSNPPRKQSLTELWTMMCAPLRAVIALWQEGWTNNQKDKWREVKTSVQAWQSSLTSTIKEEVMISHLQFAQTCWHINTYCQGNGTNLGSLWCFPHSYTFSCSVPRYCKERPTFHDQGKLGCMLRYDSFNVSNVVVFLKMLGLPSLFDIYMLFIFKLLLDTLFKLQCPMSVLILSLSFKTSTTGLFAVCTWLSLSISFVYRNVLFYIYTRGGQVYQFQEAHIRM
jgi:hypothetical protein